MQRLTGAPRARIRETLFQIQIGLSKPPMGAGSRCTHTITQMDQDGRTIETTSQLSMSAQALGSSNINIILKRPNFTDRIIVCLVVVPMSGTMQHLYTQKDWHACIDHERFPSNDRAVMNEHNIYLEWCFTVPSKRSPLGLLSNTQYVLHCTGSAPLLLSMTATDRLI